MATFKEVASTFPINAPVEWIDSTSDTIRYGVVTGYRLNALGEIIVEVRPVVALGDPDVREFFHPNNRVVQLTHAVTGDQLSATINRGAANVDL